MKTETKEKTHEEKHAEISAHMEKLKTDLPAAADAEANRIRKDISRMENWLKTNPKKAPDAG